MNTPRSKAGINASPEQKALRSVGRIKTLEAWLKEAAQCEGTDRAKDPAKVVRVQAEIDRRKAEIAELKAALDSV